MGPNVERSQFAINGRKFGSPLFRRVWYANCVHISLCSRKQLDFPCDGSSKPRPLFLRRQKITLQFGSVSDPNCLGGVPASDMAGATCLATYLGSRDGSSNRR